ncbi:MAG: response regulator [Alphaproteobacteria bacterium]|nr:response regulator [Alphaproteobacteria bacterium]
MHGLAAQPHILVVDDDVRLRELLGRYLHEHRHVVMTAESAAAARDVLKHFQFDLMVLDIMMPGEDGLQFAKNLRAEKNALARLPILLLTAKSEGDDRIAGLKSGADDYLTKPFEPEELLLRIQAIIRRTQQADTSAAVIHFGGWRYEKGRDELVRGAERLKLTDMEGRLLGVLAARAGQTVSRDELAELSKVPVGGRTIDVQVARLRRRIEADPSQPRYLLTVRGEGYMLLPETSS